MCISQSVGRKGKNLKYDVRTIQIVLNLNLGNLIPLRDLDEDGKLSDNLVFAIETFQSRVIGSEKPDGRVDPGGKTLKKLREGMPAGFSEEKLRGIMIHASEAVVAKYYAALASKMGSNSITTPLRMAHFLAQLGHESGEFRYTEEIASGAAYEGRKDLGNTQKGDGKRFKGRGLIQLTGRANYKAYGDDRGTDYTKDDTAKLLSSDPTVAVDVSCWFWSKRNLNSMADADNVNGVTKKINGGLNGLADRKAKLVRAKFFLVP